MPQRDSTKRVTLDDVAELTGVHKATVSRALDPATAGQISDETVRRVQEAARQLGYVPNIVARGLRKNASMTIGVVIPDLTNPFFPPIVRGIEDHLQPRGYTALIANTDGDDAIEQSQFTTLLGRRVDGLIVATGRHGDQPVLTRAHAAGVRAVMLNRDAGPLPYPLVTGDDADGITAAVEHLHELGHRDIVHIAGPLDLSTSIVRADAFRGAVDAREGMRGTLVEASGLTVAAGRESMERILAEKPRPTAVVASNDLIALGVLRALRAHGLACPGDVSVVGFNDMLFAEDMQPPLTTVRVPAAEMGAEAARMLLAQLDGQEQDHARVVLPVSLVVRDSTGPAPR